MRRRRDRSYLGALGLDQPYVASEKAPPSPPPDALATAARALEIARTASLYAGLTALAGAGELLIICGWILYRATGK